MLTAEVSGKRRFVDGIAANIAPKSGLVHRLYSF